MNAIISSDIQLNVPDRLSSTNNVIDSLRVHIHEQLSKRHPDLIELGHALSELRSHLSNTIIRSDADFFIYVEQEFNRKKTWAYGLIKISRTLGQEHAWLPKFGFKILYRLSQCEPTQLERFRENLGRIRCDKDASKFLDFEIYRVKKPRLENYIREGEQRIDLPTTAKKIQNFNLAKLQSYRELQFRILAEIENKKKLLQLHRGPVSSFKIKDEIEALHERLLSVSNDIENMTVHATALKEVGQLVVNLQKWINDLYVSSECFVMQYEVSLLSEQFTNLAHNFRLRGGSQVESHH